ncbi:ABC transporter permease [Vibrio breoganii]|uniref:ABC transporter permease n=2 Tax=Vibrio TaxID=662 RepID=A0AAN1CSA6_9VIBR|nr:MULTISPECIES: ABC transporter permease [Vibrio]ANO33109.1 ABC transporter permease [Vibrio breoganii]MDN3714753.1 ABC transporter permease [Vibrio breoganii]OED90075.1 ABC transporter permease [Vibrio breoganii ZF-55]PMG82911.1 ABC transporter permease [Vibrio breoganii]PML01398.1 ABC transporter permease [Vibrio breoganii]
MNIGDTTIEAIKLLLSLDPALWKVVSISFSVSLFALSLSLLPAIAIALLLAYAPFPGRNIVTSIVNTLQAVPTVVIGLLLYMTLSRSGPMGDWQWLFTQKAMILGQILIAMPILISMLQAGFQSVDMRNVETSITLGKSYPQVFRALLWETRFALIAAIVTAFSRIVTEVGCSMMVGGNILGHTRNIPTAIALESSRGAFSQGVALGIVLLLLALILNFVLTSLRGQSHLRV